MLRHSEQWRFGVFWQDDGSDGQGGSTGFSVSFGGAPPGQGGIGSDAVAGGTAGAPAGVAAHGPSGIGAPSGASAAATGGAATTGGASTATGGTAGAATGGGAGTAAGGSATGPGDGGGTAAGGSASGPGLANIAQNFFSSIMGSPANAKSLYGDSGSAAAFMSPAQIQAINKGLAQGQPSTPAFGNLGVQSLIDALSGNALGSGLGNVAQQAPSPALGSLALAIALGDTFGALGGEAPGGDTPGYGFTTTMGYPAQNPTEGVGGAPQGTPAPVGTPFGGAVSSPPASPFGGMPSLADIGSPSTPMAPAVTGVPMMGPMGPDAPPSDISTTNLSPSQTPYGVPPPGPQYGPNMSDLAPYGGMSSSSDFGAPSATTGTPSLTNTIATQPPAVSAKAVAQTIASQPADQQAQTISNALDVAQQTLTPAAYEQFVSHLVGIMDPNVGQEWGMSGTHQDQGSLEDETNPSLFPGGPGVVNPFRYPVSHPTTYGGTI